MTDNEINEAIAAVCEWTKIVSDYNHPYDCMTGCWKDPYGNQRMFRPDYCTDLNAMHEAEALLNMDDQPQFLEQLSIGTMGEPEPFFDKCFPIINATAHERAKAFLRVKGLWRE